MIKHAVFKGMFEELSIPTTGRKEKCEEFSSALLFRQKNRREYKYQFWSPCLMQYKNTVKFMTLSTRYIKDREFARQHSHEAN